MEFFHTGWVVPDLEEAMDEVASATHCTWRPIVDAVDFHVWTESGTPVLQGRRVYTVEGPPYLELVEMSGGVWGRGRPAGEAHLGYWVDDMAEAAAHLESVGMRRVVSDAGPGGSFSLFAYFVGASGTVVEILPRWRRDQILNSSDSS